MNQATQFISGNAGKPKGSKNKITKEKKEVFAFALSLLEKRMCDAEDVINRLTPYQVAQLYLSILQFIKPKLSSVKSENKNTGPVEIIVRYADKLTCETNQFEKNLNEYSMNK